MKRNDEKKTTRVQQNRKRMNQSVAIMLDMVDINRVGVCIRKRRENRLRLRLYRVLLRLYGSVSTCWKMHLKR